jgi:predicted transcriptional regulator
MWTMLMIGSSYGCIEVSMLDIHKVMAYLWQSSSSTTERIMNNVHANVIPTITSSQHAHSQP